MAELDEVDDLDATERGKGGFGSTGVRNCEGTANSQVSETSQPTPMEVR